MNNEDPLTNNLSPELEPTPNAAPTEPQTTPLQAPQQLAGNYPPQSSEFSAQEPLATPPPIAPSQQQFSQTTPPPAPSGRSYKPFAFGGAGLLAVAVLCTMIFAFFVPNQADYNQAISTYNDLADANNKLQSSLDSLTEDSPETKTKIEKDYTSYKEAFTKLKNLKALRDGETNEAYTALSKKNDEYTKYFDSILASYDDMINVSKNCSDDASAAIQQVDDLNQVLPAFDEAIGPCRDSLEKLQSSDDELIAAYGKDAISFVDDIRSTLKDLVAAVQAQNQTAYLAAEGEYNLLAQEFIEVVEKFEKDMEKEGDNKSVKKAANNFKDILEKKAESSLF